MKKIASAISLLPLVFVNGCDRAAKAHSPTPSLQREKSAAPTNLKKEGAPLTIGRYQIVSSPHIRADTFLIDTVTGRVWHLIEFPGLEGKTTAWKEMRVLSSTRDE